MKLAQLSMTVSRTFNLGNYESLRVEAGAVVEFGNDVEPNSQGARDLMLAEIREGLIQEHAAFKPKKEGVS
jgi:hypothetical protein